LLVSITHPISCTCAGRFPRSPPLFLSHPSCPFDSLGDIDSDVVPLDGGHVDRPGQVLYLVAGRGQVDQLLDGDSLSLCLPPQLSCGNLDVGDSVVVRRLGGAYLYKTFVGLQMGSFPKLASRRCT
jgi:hypothetical protein